MSSRSRRSVGGRASNALNALSRLQEAKQGAKRRFDDMEFREDDVYEEVSEDQYHEIVAKRREEFDFVVDDGIEGYADDGEENWETQEKQQKVKISKVARVPAKRGEKTVSLGPQQKVNTLFLGGGRAVSASTNHAGDEEDGGDDVQSLLAELAEDVQTETSSDGPSKKVRRTLAEVAAFGQQNEMSQVIDESMFPEFDNNNDEDVFMQAASDSAPASSSSSSLASKSGEVYNSQQYRVLPPQVGSARTQEQKVPPKAAITSPVAKKLTTSIPAQALHSPLPIKSSSSALSSGVVPPSAKAPETAGPDWSVVRNSINNASEPAPTPSSTSMAEPSVVPEGALRMFWFDAFEDTQLLPGSIFLFGKMLGSDGNTSSCALKIDEIERDLYFVPRPFALLNAQDEASVSDRPVGMAEVYAEVGEIMKKNGITKWKAKGANKKYCFEQFRSGEISKKSAETKAQSKKSKKQHGGDDKEAKEGEDEEEVESGSGERFIPPEVQCLNVRYSSRDKPLPRDLKGKTFSHVFGTKNSCLETFLLSRGLVGPGWIDVAEAKPIDTKLTWCKNEFVTESPAMVHVVRQNEPEAPPFSVLSLSLKTSLDTKSHRHEIIMASGLFHPAISVDGPAPSNYTSQLQSFSFVRMPAGHAWPIDFDATIQRNKQNMNKLQKCPNESALLNQLLAQIQRFDPDVILGHDLHGFDIEVLLARLKAQNVRDWSKLGRLKKKNLPSMTSKSGAFSLIDLNLLNGRLFCDTMVTAKELLRERTYTLTDLAMSQLKGRVRTEVDPAAIGTYLANTQGLLRLALLNENDAYLTFELMNHLLALPLTKQLTCLCGNLWSRSLRSARAERVEFLLLHEFFKLDFIVPEKFTGKERKEKEGGGGDNGGEDDGEGKKKSGRNKGKPQYAGGLVLEPKRGFYDKFVILLDFNSLYPSIIQEYNICFTTVEHWKVANSNLAEIPEPSAQPGIIPKVMFRLLERRRAVKRLLKSERDPLKREQYDIRQKAIKLVANSMYGCLGFKNSRFYCEPLAALITSQGRDILQRSVEITENLGQQVIYGDTDSIMINTNCDSVAQVYDIAKNIKKEINKRFQILEIDLDGIFKNMLLLRKKKYAALTVEEVDGKLVYGKTMKGLDLVRRDWCELSKDVGKYVLDQILSGNARETVVFNIHAHLESINQAIKNNEITLDKFIITKALTKSPRDYPDAKSQPHVNVALAMMAAGQSVRVGDVIPYIICKGEGSMSQRAYHPQAIEKAGGTLEIDADWYRSNQILPPVTRLIAPIEETDAGRVAFCLGLDPRAFQNQSKSEDANNDEEPISVSSQDYEELFKSCKYLQISCPECQEQFTFSGVFDLQGESKSTTVNPDGSVTAAVPTGLRCPNAQCAGLASHEPELEIRLANQLTMDIRQHVMRFYESWTICSEASCGLRTRQISLRNEGCIRRGCNGKLISEYSDRELYLQLLYYRSLFDVEGVAQDMIKAENERRRRETSSPRPQLALDLPPSHKDIFSNLYGHLESILDKSAYYYIQLRSEWFEPKKRVGAAQ